MSRPPEKSIFPSGFPTKTLYAFHDCSTRATCPAHLSRLDLRFLIMLGEECNEYSSTLCNFLHSPVKQNRNLNKYTVSS